MVFAINPDKPGTGANRTLDTFRKNTLVNALEDLLFGNVTTSTATSAITHPTQSGSYNAPQTDSLVAAATDDGNSDGNWQALLDKVNNLTPVVFGLLGGILVLLLAILGVGIAMCVRRGASQGAARQISPSYAPVRRQDRVDFPEGERYTDGALKYSDA